MNEELQRKYPHLEFNISHFCNVKQEMIFGSDFHSIARKNALLAIKSKHKISDFFYQSNNVIVPDTNNYAYIYDLTHSLGNFLHDIEISHSKERISNKKEAFGGDFVISRLRSYLKEMAVVPKKKQRQFFSTEYLVYRPKTNLVSSNTLLVFSLTDKVQKILKYSQYGTEHPRFYDFVFNEMPLPDCVIKMNSHIDSTMNIAHKALEQSKALYKEAQDILYTELGLDPNNPLGEIEKEEENLSISIQTLQESYTQTGRLDAEYYQKKYTKNIEIIKKGKYAKLNELVWIKKSIEPGSKAYKKSGIPFCRVSNLSVYDIGGYDVFLDRMEFLDTLEELCPSKDTILFSKDGSVGIAYCIKNNEEIITSSGILHLSIKDKKVVLPEYLCLVLNSIVVKLQAQRDCGGSVIEHWRTEEIKNALIPILSENQQNLVNQKITQSFDLRIKAKNLLKEAIAQVEAKISAQV